MRLRFLFLFLIHVVARPSIAKDWRLLALQLKDETPLSESQLVLEKPAANKLKSVFLEDFEEHQGVLICEVMAQTTAEEPVWQVAADFALNSLPENTETEQLLAFWQRAFAASIRPKDHWLKYNTPRGWMNPFMWRRMLAKRMLFVASGAEGTFPSNVPDSEMLQETPREWLLKHGKHSLKLVSLHDVGPKGPEIENAERPTTKALPPNLSKSSGVMAALILIAAVVLWIWIKMRQ